MAPNRVVKHLDIIKYVAGSLVSCQVSPAFDPFPLEQLKKALGDGVIVTVSTPTHTATQVVGRQEVLPFASGKLATLIRMDQHRLLRLTAPDRNQ